MRIGPAARLHPSYSTPDISVRRFLIEGYELLIRLHPAFIPVFRYCPSLPKSFFSWTRQHSSPLARASSILIREHSTVNKLSSAISTTVVLSHMPRQSPLLASSSIERAAHGSLILPHYLETQHAPEPTGSPRHTRDRRPLAHPGSGRWR